MNIASGVEGFDRLVGGLLIGDNVVWHDAAGSLASVFCLNFLKASEAAQRPLIYVSFDRSPKNLLDKLGALADSPYFVVLDCFTWGKGAGSEVFKRFYYDTASHPCRIIPVPDPGRVEAVTDAFYGLHSSFEGDVRFIFESLTGMEELWGGEEKLIEFYAHSCPRLYELNTVAYWILEKKAHSSRLRAQINQIAQVVVDLSVKRGTTSLTVVKAEGRHLDTHHKPHSYWVDDLEVSFESSRGGAVGPTSGLGERLRQLRVNKGFSQTDLARLVGVTPSNISQVEGGLIYPSLPALLKMAEVLKVDVGILFQGRQQGETERVLFPAAQAERVHSPRLAGDAVQVRRLLQPVPASNLELCLVEMHPNSSLPAHFFQHKGQEVGYLVSGQLEATLCDNPIKIRAGDAVCFTREAPTAWANPGRATARLLWIMVRKEQSY